MTARAVPDRHHKHKPQINNDKQSGRGICPYLACNLRLLISGVYVVHPHNMAWGGADGRMLYLAVGSTLYRMPLNVAGIRP